MCQQFWTGDKLMANVKAASDIAESKYEAAKQCCVCVIRTNRTCAIIYFGEIYWILFMQYLRPRDWNYCITYGEDVRPNCLPGAKKAIVKVTTSARKEWMINVNLGSVKNVPAVCVCVCVCVWERERVKLLVWMNEHSYNYYYYNKAYWACISL